MEQVTYNDGDIILVHVRKYSVWYRWLFGTLIKFFDQVYYHHAQIYFDGVLYEADTQVRVKLTSENDQDEIIIFRPNIPLTNDEMVIMRSFLNNEVGKTYGYLAAFLFQLLYILSGRRIWLGTSNMKAERTPYCTELVAGAWNSVRGYFPRPWLTSPYVIQRELPQYFTAIKIVK